MLCHRASWIHAAILGVGAALASPAFSAESYHWVQYVPSGVEVRAITDGAACPTLSVDGSPVAMTIRSSPGDKYSITVCSAPVAAGARKAALDGVPLPLPVAQPRRILVIGDTGCRLKGKQVQPCNDAALWPFRIGSDIGAELKPDLVLHVGDFHYRESACPEGNDGCAGSPFGDSWAVWRADFFSPAELLLNAAPWILVRGNHEECERGGKGWARTLDPYPWSSDTGCLGPAKPFVVPLPGLSIVVLDVSTADEEKANEKQAAFYRQQFQSVKDLVPEGPAWLAFHRPIWSTDGSVETEKTGGDNKTLAAAALGAIPANVQAFISGHQHKFEVDAYEQDLPIQIISGHGGDDLTPNPPKSPVGLQVNGMTIKSGFAKPRTFGFSMLERKSVGDDWSVTDYDVHGHPLGRCQLVGRTATCEEVRAGN